MPNPVTHAAITFNPETGKFGFKVWVPGKPPHFTMDTFDSADRAREWLDPQGERIWKDPEPGTEGIVAISHEYKAGSVPTRV